MIRAVLDSSVLVSAFLTVGGTSHAVLSAANKRMFVLCLSDAILEETRTSLRQKVKTIRRYYTYSNQALTRTSLILPDSLSGSPISQSFGSSRSTRRTT
jgi:predicted nucleic acid-binding protein